MSNINEKRQQLRELSAAAKSIMQMGEADSINDALIKLYEQQGHTEMQSFKSWLKNGFVVKRGEKALLLWGSPQKGVNAEKKADTDKDEYKFFPLAFVFSKQQVQPLEK